MLLLAPFPTVQWGCADTFSGQSTKVSFPISFPNEYFNITVSPTNKAENFSPSSNVVDGGSGVKYFDKTGLYAGASTTNLRFFWKAYGN